MATSADLDISGWTEQESSPIKDGNYPLSERGASAPTYTPLEAIQFAGTAGQNISQSDFASAATVAPQYSNTITGPDGESTTGQFEINAGDSNYGGEWGGSGGFDGVQTADGTDIWVSAAFYFPTAFCAGYESGGDGYGSTKWMRLGYGPSGQRITLQLGGFAADQCSVAGLEFDHVSLETVGPEEVCTFPTTGSIARDQWHKICLQIRCAQDTTGFIRGWLSSLSGSTWSTTYLGQTTNGSRSDSDTYQTIPSADDVLDNIAFGQYWNGNSYQNNLWYSDHLIVTTQTPNTTDAGGRSFIHPDHAPGDFA